MNENILKDYGWCQVIKRLDKFILRYDAGGIAIEMKEVVISRDQAERATLDQVTAEQVLVEVLKSKR